MYITYNCPEKTELDVTRTSNKEEIKLAWEEDKKKKKISLEKTLGDETLDRTYRYAPVQCPVCNMLVPSELVYDAYGFDPNENHNVKVYMHHNAIVDTYMKHTINGPELTCPHCKSKFIEDEYANETKEFESNAIIGTIMILVIIAIIVLACWKGIPALINLIKNMPKPEPKSEPISEPIPEPTPADDGFFTTRFNGFTNTYTKFAAKLLAVIGASMSFAGCFNIAKGMISDRTTVNWPAHIITMIIGAVMVFASFVILRCM